MEEIKAVKLIDIHAHAIAFPQYCPPVRWGERFICAEEVIENYDKIGVEKGILLPIASPEGQLTPMPTEDCKYIVDKYPQRFMWFCNVDPRALSNSSKDELVDLINFYKGIGAKGVGEITTHLFADDPKMMNLWAAAEETQMPVLFHIAKDEATNYGMIDELGLPRLEKLLKTFPKLIFIGHSQAFWSEISADNTDEVRGNFPKGKVTDGRIAELCRKYPNLYLDLSANSGANAMMRDQEYAVKFIKEFSDRIFYGIDMCAPSNTQQFLLIGFFEQMYKNGTLSLENYKKIARENAIRILKLDM